MKKKHLAKILAFLILGLTTTIAVAWGCSILITRGIVSRGQTQSVLLPTSDPRHWDWVWWTGSAISTRVLTDCLDGTGLSHKSLEETIKQGIQEGATWSDLPADVRSVYHRTGEIHVDSAFGWPSVALTSCRSFSGGVLDKTAIVIPTSEHKYAFPLDPVWAGIAIDTTLYATIWYGLFFLNLKNPPAPPQKKETMHRMRLLPQKPPKPTLPRMRHEPTRCNKQLL